LLCAKHTAVRGPDATIAALPRPKAVYGRRVWDELALDDAFDILDGVIAETMRGREGKLPTWLLIAPNGRRIASTFFVI
jgi:hypothetical protein